jgi:hypothetical protein
MGSISSKRMAEIARLRRQEGYLGRLSPLADRIAEDLRLAEMRLSQLRNPPELLELMEGPIKTKNTASCCPDNTDAASHPFVTLIHRNPVKAALLLLKKCGNDPLAFAICSTAAMAKATLDLTLDPDAPATSIALDLLAVACRAAQLRHIGAWQELAGVMVELEGHEWFLEQVEAEPSMPIEAVQRMIAEFEPVMKAGERAMKAQRRASEESERQRQPMQQRRIQAFARAMRSDPHGGPKRWSAAVSQEAFGGSEARHVDCAKRWFRRHRKKIQAALAADSPPDYPPVPPHP